MKKLFYIIYSDYVAVIALDMLVCILVYLLIAFMIERKESMNLIGIGII